MRMELTVGVLGITRNYINRIGIWSLLKRSPGMQAFWRRPISLDQKPVRSVSGRSPSAAQADIAWRVGLLSAHTTAFLPRHQQLTLVFNFQMTPVSTIILAAVGRARQAFGGKVVRCRLLAAAGSLLVLPGKTSVPPPGRMEYFRGGGGQPTEINLILITF